MVIHSRARPRRAGRAEPTRNSAVTRSPRVCPNTSVRSPSSDTVYVVPPRVSPLSSTTLPDTSIVRPGIAGSTVTRSAENSSGSSALLNSSTKGVRGSQPPPDSHELRRSSSDPNVRPVNVATVGFVRGPSADGVSGPIVIVNGRSGGSSAAGRNATERPSSASPTAVRARRSAWISASVASRSGVASPSASSVVDASTPSGSTRWSKVATKTGVSEVLSASPTKRVTDGGGVPNVQLTVCASSPPTAEVVPAGTVTRYSVAAGRRSTSPGSISNRSVRVPIHRQRPSITGVTSTGTSTASSWSSVATGIIG